MAEKFAFTYEQKKRMARQTAEILTKVLFLAEDDRIQDPRILEQIRIR